MHHAFLYISLPVFARLRRENAQFRFLWSTQKNDEILFLFLDLDWSLGIQLQQGLPNLVPRAFPLKNGFFKGKALGTRLGFAYI